MNRSNMGTNLRPVSEGQIEKLKKVSVSLQTHPEELPSRDFKTLLKMISDYEGESLPLKIEPDVACASVQKDFIMEEYDNCRNQAEASAQTDKLKELESQHSCYCKASVSTQANMDEEEGILKHKTETFQETLLKDSAHIQETKPVAKSVSVQTVKLPKVQNGSIVQNGIPNLSRKRSSHSLVNELETFKLELEHMFNIMKCEQHILDLRFSILETRHEVVDDRVIGILKFLPEAMEHINPRPRKRVTMFQALRHFVREAVFGSLLVAILSFSTLYTTLVNIIKYNYM